MSQPKCFAQKKWTNQKRTATLTRLIRLLLLNRPVWMCLCMTYSNVCQEATSTVKRWVSLSKGTNHTSTPPPCYWETGTCCGMSRLHEQTNHCVSIHCMKQQLSVFGEAYGATAAHLLDSRRRTGEKKNVKSLNGGRCLATDATA